MGDWDGSGGRKVLERAKGIIEKVIYVVVFGYLIGFAVGNDEATVDLKLWWGGDPQTYRAFFPVIIAFGAGVAMAGVIAFLETVRRIAELRRCRRHAALLEDEIARLRNLPIEEDLGAPLTPEAPGDAGA